MTRVGFADLSRNRIVVAPMAGDPSAAELPAAEIIQRLTA